jgi:hypothetical protein
VDCTQLANRAAATLFAWFTVFVDGVLFAQLVMPLTRHWPLVVL